VTREVAADALPDNCLVKVVVREGQEAARVAEVGGREECSEDAED
jgi:hypothetical protein